MRMKAWGISRRGTFEEVKLFEIEKPKLTPTEVIVEVKASSLNPADLKVLSGKDGGVFLHASKFPLFLGYDYAGVVVEVGDQSKDISVGDEIFGFLPYAMSTKQGAFSQFLSISPNSFSKKPAMASFVESATLGTTAITALQSLRDKGAICAGNRVLINGASGGVGSAAVQIAKIFGAEVWAICSEKNFAYVRQLGADHTVDYKTKRIDELTAKFDIVFDVASNSSFLVCEKVLNPKGIYITLLPTLGLLTGFLMSVFSDKACRFYAAKPVAADFKILSRWVDEGKLKPTLSSSVLFEKIPAGLKLLASQTECGKIGVVFDISGKG